MEKNLVASELPLRACQESIDRIDRSAAATNENRDGLKSFHLPDLFEQILSLHIGEDRIHNNRIEVDLAKFLQRDLAVGSQLHFEGGFVEMLQKLVSPRRFLLR